MLFEVKILHCEKEVITGNFETIVFPSKLGDVAILFDHAPYLFTIKPGFISLYNNSIKISQMYFTTGGFAEVKDNLLILFLDDYCKIVDLTLKDLDRYIKNFHEDLGKYSIEKKFLKDKIYFLESEKEILKNRISILKDQTI